MLKSTRPKIFFVPSYIGGLKYFIRVAKPLRDTYDVSYLIIHQNKEREREMTAFCAEHNVPFFVITQASYVPIRIPFLAPIWKRCVHRRQCRAFLRSKRPAKIVVSKTKSPHDVLIKEANNLGIETILLQWAFYWRRYGAEYRKQRRVSAAQALYFSMLNTVSSFFDGVCKGLQLTPGVARPERIGVFDAIEAEYRARFFDSQTIHITGTPDFQMLYELKQKIDRGKAFKEKLLARYGFNPRKKRIVFILCRYYPDKKDDLGLTPEEHIAYYYDILKMTRAIFPKDEAELYVKLRPSEGNVYDSYKELGVRFYGDEANTEELVAIADLYIGYPETSVNYMVLGSGIPALFVNLTARQSPEECLKTFHIRSVVLGKEDFLKSLVLFRGGALPRQYDNSKIELHSLDKIVQLIND